MFGKTDIYGDYAPYSERSVFHVFSPLFRIA